MFSKAAVTEFVFISPGPDVAANSDARRVAKFIFSEFLIPLMKLGIRFVEFVLGYRID